MGLSVLNLKMSGFSGCKTFSVKSKTFIHPTDSWQANGGMLVQVYLTSKSMLCYYMLSPLRILLLIPVASFQNSFMTFVVPGMCFNYLYTCYISSKQLLKNGVASSPSLDLKQHLAQNCVLGPSTSLISSPQFSPSQRPILTILFKSATYLLTHTPNLLRLL